MKRIVAASILGQKDPVTLVTKLINAGFNWIHYDVMDNTFVPYTSLLLPEIKHIISSTPRHTIDVHLMVSDPEEYIRPLIGIADYLSFHYEAVPQSEVAKLVERYRTSFKLGLDINSGTSVKEIEKYLDKLAFVNIMSVYPGRGGQELITPVLAKAMELKTYNPKLLVQIDGGVNDQTLPIVLKQPINIIVSGSFLLKNFENKSFVTELEKILKKV